MNNLQKQLDMIDQFYKRYSKGEIEELWNSIPRKENDITLEKYLELIDIYNTASMAYYQSDESIMSDSEFDALKEEIESVGIESITGEVEPKTNDSRKLDGDSDMISLSKTQVFGGEFEDSHASSVLNWLKQYNSNINWDTGITIGYKWDGVALRLDYEDGILVEARTRGNFSVMDKFKDILPHTLIQDYTGQIRVEVVMDKNLFEDKYSGEYQNPRNLVSGIMNDENPEDQRKYDLSFIIISNGREPIDIDDFYNFGLDKYTQCECHAIIRATIKDLSIYYNIFKSGRLLEQFPIDGIVVTLRGVLDYKIKGKYPLFARAIKFPPTKQVTTIREINWRMNKLGEWIPKLLMDPVDIDGSTVKQCLAFNYGWVVENGAYPGAKVEIAKNGDIIPYIQQVLEPGDETLFILPKDNTEVVGIHLMSTDNELTEQEQFITGCMSLGFLGVSRKTYEKIGPVMNWDIVNLFDIKTLEKLEGMIGDAMFKKLSNYIYNKSQSLNVYDVIRMIQIPKCGAETSMMMAKRISGLDWTEVGLDRSIIHAFDDGEKYNILYNNTTFFLKKFGVNVWNMEPEKSSDISVVKYVMTGSPSEYGYNNKKDFEISHPKWKQVKNLNDFADPEKIYLITDDINSSTAKMNKARKLGVEIIDYKTAHERYEND